MPNPFATDSGNNYAGYEGTIVDATAAEGTFQKQITFMVQLTNPELFPHIAGGSQNVYLSIDPDWEVNGGSTLNHPNPKKRPGAKFDYGILLKNITNDEIENSAALKAQWGDNSVRDLRNWIGYQFFWDDVEIPYGGYLRDDNGQEVLDDNGKKIYVAKLGVKSRVLPTIYLGHKGAPATNGQVNVMTVSELNLDADFEPELTGALNATSDYKAFIDSFSGPSFAKAFKAVPDAGVYAALKAGSATEF